MSGKEKRTKGRVIDRWGRQRRGENEDGERLRECWDDIDEWRGTVDMEERSLCESDHREINSVSCTTSPSPASNSHSVVSHSASVCHSVSVTLHSPRTLHDKLILLL